MTPPPLETPPPEEPRRREPISAVVVTCDDQRRLGECLAALAGFDELLVVDLGSRDESVAIARRAGARLLTHPHVDAVEEVRPWAVAQAAHRWVISPDPDEILAPGAEAEIRRLIASHEDLGRLGLPWPFYLKGTAVEGTLWGRRQHKGIVYRRDRVEMRTINLRGVVDLPRWRRIDLPYLEEFSLRHHWSDSYRDLLAKHLRYARKEGEARWRLGQRFSWRFLAREVRRSARLNLRTHRPPRWRWRWLALSLFHALFIALSLLSLRAYGRGQPGPDDSGTQDSGRGA
ncbi:MAG: glycosyltransferase [Acidobacteriota bacterium]